MKMNDIVNIRRIVLISYITSKLINKHTDIDFNNVTAILSSIYSIDILTQNYTARLTSDYKELKEMYDEIVVRTVNMTRELELTHPVEIHALYVYLLRNGYLSYNNYFEYNTEMKDLPKLMGIDVIRGSGVCRSISSMLTDLYNKCGYEAINLSVYATGSSCKYQQKLCDTELNSSEKSSKFVDIVSFVTGIFHTANHQITNVIDGKYNYILDPTNDGMLHKGKGRKLYVPGTDSFMRFKSSEQMLMSILYAQNKEKNVIRTYKNLALNQISDEEYRNIYLNALKECKDNLALLSEFYSQNEKLYEDIYKLSDEQGNFIERMIPIIPKKRIVKK